MITKQELKDVLAVFAHLIEMEYDRLADTNQLENADGWVETLSEITGLSEDDVRDVLPTTGRAES